MQQTNPFWLGTLFLLIDTTRWLFKVYTISFETEAMLALVVHWEKKYDKVPSHNYFSLLLREAQCLKLCLKSSLILNQW